MLGKMGMCQWMGFHFYNWIDYTGVAHSQDFEGTKILASTDLQMGKFLLKKVVTYMCLVPLFYYLRIRLHLTHSTLEITT